MNTTTDIKWTVEIHFGGKWNRWLGWHSSRDDAIDAMTHFGENSPVQWVESDDNMRVVRATTTTMYEYEPLHDLSNP